MRPISNLNHNKTSSRLATYQGWGHFWAFLLILINFQSYFYYFFVIESLPGAISELVGLQIVEFISAGTPGLGGSGGSIELGSAEGRGAAWTIIGLSRFLSLSSAGASLLSVSTSKNIDKAQKWWLIQILGINFQVTFWHSRNSWLNMS